MHSIGKLFATTCATLSFCSVALAIDPAPLTFNELDGIDPDVAIPWAQPIATGPMDIVAIAPYATMGDLARLQAHLECRMDTIATWDRDHLGFDPLFPEPAFPAAAQEEVENRLARQLDRKRLDAIILGQVDPAILPESVQQRIIAHVEGGAGLVITSSGLVPGSPLADWLLSAPEIPDGPTHHGSCGPLGIPQLEQENLVTYHSAGEGRIAAVTFQHAPSPNHALVPVPENPYLLTPENEANAFSLICKTLLWAAGREAPVRIGRVLDVAPKGPGDEEVPPGYPREFIESVRRNAFNQPIRPFVLELMEPAENTYDVVYQLRVPGAHLPAWRVESGTELSKGEIYCALDVVATPGDYYLDLWLKSRKGVVTWHTVPVTIAGWPRLSRIEIMQRGEEAVWVQPNDHLDIQVEAEAGAFITTGDEATVYARAVDNLERQVASAYQPVGPEGGRVSLRLELADLIAPLLRVEVFAVPSGLVSEAGLAGQAARQTFYFPVRLPEPTLEPAVLLTASGPFDYGSIRRMADLREALGSSTLHAPAGPESILAASAAGLELLAQVGSLDAGHVGAGETRVPCLSSEEFWSREESRIKSGVLASWGGGPPRYSLGAGSALTDTEANVCQNAGCLAHFRNNLRDSYPNISALNAAWDADFLSFDQVTPTPLDLCQRAGQWAPWLDFRRSMSGVFSRALARGQATIDTIPGAGKAGFVSPVTPISPIMGYDWRTLCGVMDFVTAPADPYALRRIASFHRGHAQTGALLGYSQLRDNAAWARWFAWDCLLRQIPAVWIDGAFDEGARSLVTPAGQLRPELAALATSFASIQDGLGLMLLHAQPNQTGIAFVDSPESRILDHADPEPGRTAAEAESWLDAKLNQLGFASRIISLRDGTDGLNTLILSRDRVLSDGDIALLDAFHDQGGLILSDGKAGVYDDHGRPRTKAPLPFMHPLDRDGGGEALSLWTNRPVWVSQIPDTGAAMPVLEQLLSRAGNTRGITIEVPDKLVDRVARFQFNYGAAALIACLPYPDTETTLRRASIKVPEGFVGYTLLSGEGTPTERRLQWSIEPGEPAVFALLPYRVDGLAVVAPEFVPAGARLGLQVRLDTGDSPAGPHLAMAKVFGASGEELRHYRRSFPLVDGQADTYIPLAESDPPGYYRLEVRDLLSGETATVRVEVQ